jgi:hypothetical protein
MITNQTNVQKIYLREEANYWKIGEDIVGGRNLGVIDRQGTISARKGPLTRIKGLPQFQSSPRGHSKRHGGSGYVGWVEFDSVDAGMEWLRTQFDVRLVGSHSTPQHG